MWVRLACIIQFVQNQVRNVCTSLSGLSIVSIPDEWLYSQCIEHLFWLKLIQDLKYDLSARTIAQYPEKITGPSYRFRKYLNPTVVNL